MNSAPHLLIEDRPEFERILDEVLSTAHGRPELVTLGSGLTVEQVRAMALSEAASIAARATEEYQRFVTLREELRRPARVAAARGRPGSAAGRAPGGARGVLGGAGEADGVGFGAVVTVLAPLLAGAAAVIFLIVGYLLHLVSPEPSLAAPLRTAGWTFAVLSAAGVLIACVGLLTTAVRNGARASRANGVRGDALAAQVTAARDAWREALLDRGILPYLHQVLSGSPPDAAAPIVPRQPEAGRTPPLGYSRPGFSSPGTEEPGHSSAGPRYSSPDFSSPHYGGPEHPPE